MENQMVIHEESKEKVKLVEAGKNGFIESFRESFKLANVFANSTLVPQQYQGKIEDCAIAVDMANRMGVSPLMVMQSLYVVKGKPSWSGQACMSFIKAKYGEAFPVYVGKQGTDERGCYIKAVSDSGEEIVGSTVTIGMAKSEGWTSNKKWINMPEQMLAYRAAAFFARVYCPEVLMGISVQGEIEDIESSSGKNRAKDLTEKLLTEETGENKNAE